MANLIDLSETLAKEGRLAQDYIKFRKEAKNKEFKKSLKELEKLSVEKMKIIHKIIKNQNWF